LGGYADDLAVAEAARLEETRRQVREEWAHALLAAGRAAACSPGRQRCCLNLGGSVGVVTDVRPARDLLIDLFGRIRQLVVELTDDLSDEAGIYRPDPEANSIDWLIWHATRVQDDHVADLAGVAQCWPAWRDRFALPFDEAATGYGQSPADVGLVRVDARLLADYHADVHEMTVRYLRDLRPDELQRVVDTRWDPPVTASVRLVSVIGDLQQHLGQAAYVRGLVQRRDRAWHGPGAADR
jgi:Protein of unknown function (DUF664)